MQQRGLGRLVEAEAHIDPSSRVSFGSNESRSKKDCAVGKGQLGPPQRMEDQ